jgi:hypothetical protein
MGKSLRSDSAQTTELIDRSAIVTQLQATMASSHTCPPLPVSPRLLLRSRDRNRRTRTSGMKQCEQVIRTCSGQHGITLLPLNGDMH